ncbi:MAG TPA: hypothetical protein VGG85_19890 [Terracidiphilus sp.]|jgi:hypothetical protein
MSEFLTVGEDQQQPHITPGEYEASCVKVHPEPFEYKKYKRLVKRLDFVIHGSGEVLKKYVNMGMVENPWKVIPPRSEYHKVLVAALGKKPKAGEPACLDFIANNPSVQFVVTVEDRKHREEGYTYSVIGNVRRLNLGINHPEYNSVSQCLNVSDSQLLNNSSTQSLNVSATQDGMNGTNKTNRAVDSATQDDGRAESQLLSHSAWKKLECDVADYDPDEAVVIPTTSAFLHFDKAWIAEMQANYPRANVRDRLISAAERAYNIQHSKLSSPDTYNSVMTSIGAGT